MSTAAHIRPPARLDRQRDGLAPAAYRPAEDAEDYGLGMLSRDEKMMVAVGALIMSSLQRALERGAAG